MTSDALPIPSWHSTFSAHAEAGTSTVHARGALDLFSLELLRGTVAILIDAGHVNVTLDLGQVTAIDHAGLLMLADLHDDLEARDGRLAVRNARPSIRRALDDVHL